MTRIFNVDRAKNEMLHENFPKIVFTRPNLDSTVSITGDQKTSAFEIIVTLINLTKSNRSTTPCMKHNKPNKYNKPPSDKAYVKNKKLTVSF